MGVCTFWAVYCDVWIIFLYSCERLTFTYVAGVWRDQQIALFRVLTFSFRALLCYNLGGKERSEKSETYALCNVAIVVEYSHGIGFSCFVAPFSRRQWKAGSIVIGNGDPTYLM
jgi:hypothetical protein